MYCEQAVREFEALPESPPLKSGVCQPWLDVSVQEFQESTGSKGLLQYKAASLLMKALYCARMVRLDLSFTINYLSKFITKWDSLCDKRIAHLYAYIKNSCKTALHAKVDPKDRDEVFLAGFPDADLAGAEDTSRSCSGGFLCLTSPSENTFIPLDWYSKRQTATAHSTTEAEMVSLSKMIREILAPQLELWSLLLQRDVRGVLHEDNESTIVVAKSGYSSQLRHMQKHHRISLGLVNDFVSRDSIDLVHCPTEEQKGDLMTKGLSRAKHVEAMRLVQLYSAYGMGAFSNEGGVNIIGRIPNYYPSTNAFSNANLLHTFPTYVSPFEVATTCFVNNSHLSRNPLLGMI